jgi:hypothetical protein
VVQDIPLEQRAPVGADALQSDPLATHLGTVLVENADVLTQQLPSLHVLPAQQASPEVPHRVHRFSAPLVL